MYLVEILVEATPVKGDAYANLIAALYGFWNRDQTAYALCVIIHWNTLKYALRL